MPLIEFTDNGLYCATGNFYIDPWKPVDKAIITHAHSDHARFGSNSYLCHPLTKPILQLRLGDVQTETIGWNQPISMNGVKISLHPAGHIIGSSQVRIEYQGEVWVVSGDYKTEDDGISGVFEPVRCDTFITESTFGLPIYNWKPEAGIFDSIRAWISETQEQGKVPILIGYSLGKAQRILKCIAPVAEKIYVHGAIWNIQQALLAAGVPQPEVFRVSPDTPNKEYRNSVIVAPNGAEGSPWIKRFAPYRIANCSGWMQVRGNVRRRNTDAAFALSDHADWNGLVSSVKATNASKVFVTHGFQSAFSRYLSEVGIEAAEVKTEFGMAEDPATVDIPEES
jgi:putative mRNA 3-end processing factor